MMSRLVNSLIYFVALRPLAKAPVRRCGGSTQVLATPARALSAAPFGMFSEIPESIITKR